MYLTPDDFDLVIKEDRLDIVTEKNPKTLQDACIKAQSEAESYLSSHFDLATEMGRKGSNRSPVLVMYITDMALYHLVSRINPRNISQLRQDRYDNAIAWFRAVSRGEVTPELPRIAPEDNPGTGRFGSNAKDSHRW